MRSIPKSRLCRGALLSVLLCAVPAFGRGFQPQPTSPASRPIPTPPRPGPRQAAKQAQNQDHLAQWMERHSSLSLPEQLRALENEPGFHDYPPQTQQRMRDQLVKLNNMTPAQRSQILSRTELLEQMTPPQRQQFRSTMQQYGGLAEDRRRLVAHAFKELRVMPPAEAQSILENDPRVRTEFSDYERGILHNLLVLEPYMPGKGPAGN